MLLSDEKLQLHLNAILHFSYFFGDNQFDYKSKLNGPRSSFPQWHWIIYKSYGQTRRYHSAFTFCSTSMLNLNTNNKKFYQYDSTILLIITCSSLLLKKNYRYIINYKICKRLILNDRLLKGEPKYENNYNKKITKHAQYSTYLLVGIILQTHYNVFFQLLFFFFLVDDFLFGVWKRIFFIFFQKNIFVFYINWIVLV